MRINPITVTILTTDTCTATCAHCCVSSSPLRKMRLTSAQIMSYVDELQDTYPNLQLVVFAGGELTLLKRALFESISHIHDRGLGTRVVTNASWAISDNKSERMVARLREAGLDELNISVDDYHLPYIPFTNVLRAWKASKAKGFEAVIIANSTTADSNITPGYIQKSLSEKIHIVYDEDGREQAWPAPDVDGTLYAIHNTRTARMGRARKELAGSSFHIDAGLSHKSRCPYIAIQPAISPQGELLSCCGYEVRKSSVLNFGKIKADIKVKHKQAQNDVLINALHYLGPSWLRDYCKLHGAQADFFEEYVSMCEVCEDVLTKPDCVSFLRSREADIANNVLAVMKTLEEC